jgi:hypothetical protein
MRALLVLLVGCWTGPDDTPVAHPSERPPPQLALEVRLVRTVCFGDCPSYSVTIHGDGSVDWEGHSSVAQVGGRSGHVSRQQLAQLERAIDAAHFFELDETGHKSPCTTTGNTTSCSFTSVTPCTDTYPSHAIVTVRRGRRVHTVDDSRCSEHEPSSLAALEDMIDRVASTRAWIER